MRSPTMIDAMIRETMTPSFRRHVDTRGNLRHRLLAARRFVLDEAMSAFMADLAYAPLDPVGVKRNPARDNRQMEAWRHSARIPHASTWIEYDFRAKRRRALEYGVKIPNDDDLPERHGWLLEQHPEIETAFMATGVTSHSLCGGDKLEAVANPGLMSWVWRSDDDGPPPWYTVRVAYASDALPPGAEAAILTGMVDYRTDKVGVIGNTFMDREFIDQVPHVHLKGYLNENYSDLRYLWSLLSAINDVPTVYEHVRPSRGYVARGSYRKFVEHTVIHLRVPQRASVKTLARKVARIARRRAHTVRGHWRRDHRHPGERMWIKEHDRGDASLGYVVHDYAVERGDGSPKNIG